MTNHSVIYMVSIGAHFITIFRKKFVRMRYYLYFCRKIIVYE